MIFFKNFAIMILVLKLSEYPSINKISLIKRGTFPAVKRMKRYKATLLFLGLVIFLIFLAGDHLLASRSYFHNSTRARSAESPLPYLVKLPEKSIPQKKPPVLEELIIVSGSNSIPDNRSKLISYDEPIYLCAVIKDTRGNYYLGYDDSLPPMLRIDNEKYTITDGSFKRWKKDLWGPLQINWYRIMPRMKPLHPESEYEWYSNVFTEGPNEGKFRAFTVLKYKQEPLPQKGWMINPKKEAGTHRFRAEINYQGKIISSPGQEDPSQPSHLAASDYDKGIKPTVHRISRLSNHENNLIRYMEALREVPWCWGTSYKIAGKPELHQAELTNPISIECSDLVISALRAMGNKNLVYTSALELARGVYTEPIDERTFRLVTLDLFEEWVPKGLSFHNGFYYLCGKGKIKIFDLDFKTEKDIESPSANYLDIAISENGKIFLINETKDLEREIEILDLEGKVEKIIRPKVERTLTVGGQIYTTQVELRPQGIGVDDEGRSIYLLTSDTLYLFDLDGNLQKKIKLEKLSDPFVPVGSLSVEENLAYVPAYKKEILIYNLRGKMVNRITPPDALFGLDVDEERYYLVVTSPFRIEIRRLDGTFVRDSLEKLIDQDGAYAVVRIGSSEDPLQVGDLILSGEEGQEISHTLVLYEDTNFNQFLDRFDKLIYAGHEGVMISTVEEKLGSRYFILKRIDSSVVKID